MASGCEQHGQSCLDLKCLLNHFCLWSSPAWQSVSKVSWRHRTESAESRAVAANEKVKKTLAIAPDRLTSSPPGYNLEAYVLLETNHISLNVSRHLFHLVNHRDLEPRGWAVYKVEFWATICVVLTYIPSTSTPSIPTELFWLDASHPLTSPGSPSFTNRATCCSLSNHNYPLPSVCCSGPVITSAFFFPLSSLIPFLFFEEKKIETVPSASTPPSAAPPPASLHTHTQLSSTEPQSYLQGTVNISLWPGAATESQRQHQMRHVSLISQTRAVYCWKLWETSSLSHHLIEKTASVCFWRYVYRRGAHLFAQAATGN